MSAAVLTTLGELHARLRPGAERGSRREWSGGGEENGLFNLILHPSLRAAHCDVLWVGDSVKEGETRAPKLQQWALRGRLEKEG